MTNITHSISVDIQKHAKRQVVYMKQGDAMSRELTISFYNDGAVWALPNDVTVLQFAYCKEDFVGGCYDHMPDNTAAFTINTGRTSAAMKIHPQVLTVAGNVICELRLLNASAHVLNTFNFVINVEKSPIAMMSSSEGYYNNVFDGATFTPHVSDAGILSWTNDKGLPNPAPIDLKEFVVDPSDIPVVPMDIITSGNAVANANNDNAVLTPAAAKAIAQAFCPEPIATTTNASYSRTVYSFDATKTYHEGDLVLYGNQVTALRRCSVAEHTGAWNASHFPKIDGDSDLFQIADGVDLREYIPAILAGNAKLYFDAKHGKPFILPQACKASEGEINGRQFIQTIFQNVLGHTTLVFLTLGFYLDDGEILVRKAECFEN